MHVFVRIVRHFDNGHSCSAAGIATFDQGRFVYRTRQWLPEGDPTCTLVVTPTREGLSVTDRLGPRGVSTCRALCGERGNLSEFTLRGAHRAIPNLAQLMRSDDYVDALAEFNENTRVR